MPTMLVITVGGSPDPIVFSLKQEPRPDRVIFVCSQESRESLEGPARETISVPGPCPECGQQKRAPYGILFSCAAEGFPLELGQLEVVELTDEQRMTECIDDIELKVTPRVEEWAGKGETYAVVVDATGGTKCMSIALALVARRWHCTFRYIGGALRGKDGGGAVLTGHERAMDCMNPLEALGYQLVDDALTLAARMNFDSARQMLEVGRRSLATIPNLRITALERILALFAEWDRFDHVAALKILPEVERHSDRLRLILSDESVRYIKRNLPEWKEKLTVLAAGVGASRELVEDLFANAQRRMKEGRYEDATARLYRGVEALAQWTLIAKFGIETAAVPPSKLPLGFRDNVTESVQLGLQESYKLLSAFGHPLGDAFDVRLSEAKNGEKSPLRARNNSILAHGFEKTSEKACRALERAALELAEAAGLTIRDPLAIPLRRSGHTGLR